MACKKIKIIWNSQPHHNTNVTGQPIDRPTEQQRICINIDDINFLPLLLFSFPHIFIQTFRHTYIKVLLNIYVGPYALYQT